MDQVKGLENVISNLNKLDDQMTKKTFSAATKAGAEIILAASVANAPKVTGFMASMIKIRSSNRPTQGLYKSSVGVGDKDFTGKAFYASFLIFGHKVGSRKLGDARKKVEANDFLKRSTEQVAAQAAQAMIDTIANAIEGK